MDKIIMLIKGLFFGVLLLNTVGVILFVAGVGLWLSGNIILAIPVGLFGAYIVAKTDDIL